MNATADHLIVLPGGGYAGLSPDEADPIVEWLEGVGLHASVFRYPTGRQHPAVVDAIHAEVRRLRQSGIDRIGVVGFSAGGHAAGHAALTSRQPSERIDLAILGYPVVSMVFDPESTTCLNLLGAGATDTLRKATSLEFLVTAQAPPFFVWHTAADAAVRVEHSYLLANALATARARHAVHVFPLGGHGLALARKAGGAESWTGLCEAWLRSEGWLSALPNQS